MKKILFSLLAAVVLVGISVAQSAQSQASGSASQQTSVAASQSGAQAGANASAAASQTGDVAGKNAQVATASQVHAGSTIQAELVKSVDARKNKVGDEVVAKTTHDVKSDGHVVLPKGSKLIGHVTTVKAHSKEEANSELAIAFDHAILKDGTEMPLALSIQAIGRGQASAAAADDTMASGGGSPGPSGGHNYGGGGMGGARSAAGGVLNTANSAVGTTAHTTGAAGGAVSGPLSGSSQGVVGLPGLSLSTQTSASTNASVISSRGSNVHLDSGTEIVLQVSQ